MKIRNFLFIFCSIFLSVASAENHHYYANDEQNNINIDHQNFISTGTCDIEIINDSFDDINVYGRFEDGSYMTPFVIKYWSEPHYISLFYFGTCHSGMDFYIDTVGGKHKYNGFTPVGKTIRIKDF